MARDVKDTSKSFLELIGDAVRQIIEGSDILPTIDFMTFSGKPEDVIGTDGKVALRLRYHAVSGLDGRPGEIVARLVGPSALFHVPTVETEMLVIIPPHMFGKPGTGWCFWGTLDQPLKVSLDKAALFFADTVTFVSKAKAHIFKSADGFVFGTNPTNVAEQQGFQASGTKTRVFFSNEVIEFLVHDGASPPNTRAVLRIDENGIHMSAVNTSLDLDRVSGKCTTIGNGFYAAHAGGCLGPVPGAAQFIAQNLGAATASASWKVCT